MPTCRDIITSAYRKVTSSEETMSAASAEDGLAQLQSLYLELVMNAGFGSFRDVLPTSNYTACEQDRVKLSAGVTATIPASVTDCWTGDLRAPLDLACIVVIDPANPPAQISVYDAMLGAWVRLDGLTFDSSPPLYTRGQDGLACRLALRMASDGYGAAPDAVTTAAADRWLDAISHRSTSDRTRHYGPHFF